ncbi:alpha-galactosidase [Saccharopolyspora shandongensis]|uniref:Alpha-galactosidase n=1 Tax=Saccharopolyspora shandongensis TaxID=418495 RepID=A0A1H3KKP0_9PSEU|nr:glycoside hydrolase family 27 protein [Saccharopolyspora shandongensis]SDY52629.1 alpha-galactosidase [Saccharopolyspora shandongensis]
MLLVTTLLLTMNGTAGAADDPAPAPPMGWNSWNKFGCDINEQLIIETADAMVASGMKDAGYQYVNIDDCWMAPERGADGRLQPDPVRFPAGIKAVADHVHAKGLKLGIYSSAGTKTCQGLPASLDHEEVDARTFADWGVDYLKYDNCNNEGRPAVERYQKMGEALRATGRPIVYSICEWGENDPWEWGREVGGHLWRTTGDISDSWNSMTGLLDQQVGIEQHSGPNGWNDPDMLEVGNGGMTDAEYRAHFSLWALLNAPLLAGNDLRTMDQSTKDIMLNPELIAINQDWGGKQGYRVRDDGETEVWAKPVSDGSVAVVLFNRTGEDQDIQAKAGEVGLPDAAGYRSRDLWTGVETSIGGEIRASVPSHGAVAYRVWPNPGEKS